MDDPEAYPRSYYPDNEPVYYKFIDNALGNSSTSGVERASTKWTLLKEDNQVEVTHKVTNIGS